MLGTQVHPAANGSEVAVPSAPESNPRVILLDIEGTTTPVSFVYETLFPYATRNLQPFLLAHFQEPEVRQIVEDLRTQPPQNAWQGLLPPLWNDETNETRLRSANALIQWLIARDSKCPPLKTLQGKIWQEGYARGELRGEVYEDVPRAFVRWRQQGREVCIYSSGSIVAQQLLFRTTQAGDLTRHISNFFDTQTGPKSESESYKKIAASVGRPPVEVLFISDAIKEIDAARTAGMNALLCVREGDANDSRGRQPAIRTFDEVD